MSGQDPFIQNLENRFLERWSERIQESPPEGDSFSDRERVIYRAAYQKAYWDGVLDAMDLGLCPDEDPKLGRTRDHPLRSTPSHL